MVRWEGRGGGGGGGLWFYSRVGGGVQIVSKTSFVLKMDLRSSMG